MRSTYREITTGMSRFNDVYMCNGIYFFYFCVNIIRAIVIMYINIIKINITIHNILLNGNHREGNHR